MLAAVEEVAANDHHKANDVRQLPAKLDLWGQETIETNSNARRGVKINLCCGIRRQWIVLSCMKTLGQLVAWVTLTAHIKSLLALRVLWDALFHLFPAYWAVT